MKVLRLRMHRKAKHDVSGEARGSDGRWIGHTSTTYLSDEHMDKLIKTVADMHKASRSAGITLHGDPYLVIVDDEQHSFKTTASLRKFLSACVFPPGFKTFRNGNGAVCINLDDGIGSKGKHDVSKEKRDAAGKWTMDGQTSPMNRDKYELGHGPIWKGEVALCGKDPKLSWSGYDKLKTKYGEQPYKAMSQLNSALYGMLVASCASCRADDDPDDPFNWHERYVNIDKKGAIVDGAWGGKKNLIYRNVVNMGFTPPHGLTDEMVSELGALMGEAAYLPSTPNPSPMPQTAPQSATSPSLMPKPVTLDAHPKDQAQVYSHLTLLTLRQLCKDRSISSVGNKDVLIAKLIKYDEKYGSNPKPAAPAAPAQPATYDLLKPQPTTVSELFNPPNISSYGSMNHNAYLKQLHAKLAADSGLTEGWVSNVNHSWNGSSTKNAEAAAFQLATAQAFKIPASTHLTHLTGIVEDSGKTHKVDKLVPLAHAMYAFTQERLKSIPGDTIRMYRAVTVREQKGQPSLVKAGQKIEFVDNPLASWSSSQGVANGFLNLKHSAKHAKYLLVADIPKKDIMACPTSGLGCVGEKELVVISRGTIKAEVITHKSPNPVHNVSFGKSASEDSVVVVELDHDLSDDWIREISSYLKLTTKKFNPNERRDDAGKWTITPGKTSVLGSAFADATKANGKKWVQANQERYDNDPEFQQAADAITMFTQGNYRHLRAMAKFELSGEWPEQYEASEVPKWYAHGRKMSAWAGTYFANQNTANPKDKDYDEDYFQSRTSHIDGTRAMIKAVSTAPPIDTPLYRGIGSSISSQVLEQYKTLKPGATLSLPAPTSFTTDRGIADKIAAGVGAGFGSARSLPSRNRILIEVEEGARGIHVGALSPWKQEEVISSGKFKVISNTTTKDYFNTYRSDLTVIKVKQVGVWKQTTTKAAPAIDYDGQDQPEWITTMFDEPWFPSELTEVEGTKVHDVSGEARAANGRWTTGGGNRLDDLDEWEQSLSKEQQFAVKHAWMGNSYEGMRTDDKAGIPNKYLDLFKEAVATAPLWEGEVHRGMGKELRLKKGDTYELPAMSSFSTNRAVAKIFCSATPSRSPRPNGSRFTLLTITDHKGAARLPTKSVGGVFETEAVMEKGRKFKVVSVEPLTAKHGESGRSYSGNHITLTEI